MDSIYDDLDVHPRIEEEYAKVQAVNNELSKKIALLESEMCRLSETANNLKKRQEDLERNISSLYNTARAELDRKDQYISELQIKLDDFYFRRSSCAQKENNDASRQGSHTSRGTSPATAHKEVRERRVSPRKTKKPCDSMNTRNASGNRDIRDKGREFKDRGMNRRYTPPIRSRLGDRKSPPSKRGRNEQKQQNPDKDVMQNAKRKRYEPESEMTSNNRNSQHSNDYLAKDNVLIDINKEVMDISKQNEIIRLDVSSEEGEIIESDPITRPKTVIDSKSNKNPNKTSEKATSKNNKLHTNFKYNKSDKDLKKPEMSKFDSRCKKKDNLPISEPNSRKALENYKKENKQLNIQNIRAEKAVELEKLKAENKKLNVASNSESAQTQIPNIPLVQSLMKILKDSSSQIETVKEAAENNTKLFAPKPSSVLSADILFNNAPLSLPKSDASHIVKSINEIENNSRNAADKRIIHVIVPSNVTGNAAMNETTSHFNPNNSSITNSTQIVSSSVSNSEDAQPSNTINISISCNVPEDNHSKSTDSNNDSTIMSPGMEVQSIELPTTPGKSIQNVLLGTAGRGKPRPKRRGGVVKMID